jgi:hypothetical protein
MVSEAARPIRRGTADEPSTSVVPKHPESARMTLKKKVATVAGLALLACGLSACAMINHSQAQSRMEQSEDAYLQCLQLYPREPARCDELKKSYERDKAAYEKT